MVNHHKVPTEQIIEFIKQQGAANERQIENQFNYCKNALHGRLLNLITKKKIEHIMFPFCGKQASKIFSYYQGNRIYYINSKGLSLWIKNQIPDDASQSLRKSINQSIRSIGVDISITQHRYKTISLSSKTYKTILSRSKRLGISMSQYISDLVDKDIE